MRKLSLALLFGVFSLYIDVGHAAETESQTQAQVSAATAVTEKPNPDDGLWVEVESSNLMPTEVAGVSVLVPYRNRRENWGHTFGIGFSTFYPSNYEPNFIAAGFDDVYNTQAELPMLEIQYSFKRNLSFGSIGAEVGVGMYQNQSDTDLLASEMQVIPVRLGASLYLDSIWPEPYVVPYIAGGLHTMVYDESIEASAYGGNTQIAPYFSLGVEFQLNWIDGEGARTSYAEAGIENTFFYIEGRKFMASSAVNDPDFSTGFDWGAGMRLEF